MFATNVAMSPRARTYMASHKDLFEPLALADIWYVKTAASFLDMPVDDRVVSYMGGRLLILFAARMRELAASRRMAETGLDSDDRASGRDPNRCFLEYAERVEAYLEGKGLAVEPLFTPEIAPGSCPAETEWARSTLAAMQVHAMLAVSCELLTRPAWQHGMILESIEDLKTVLKGPIEAAVLTGCLQCLQEHGPADMFRVLVRHHAKLADPAGLTPEEAIACARTRRILADVGILPRAGEDAATAMALAMQETREAMEFVSMSFNGWLAKDHRRWAKPGRFDLRTPLRAGVVADMIDLGLAERIRGKLRLTRLGAEACQIPPEQPPEKA